MAVNVLKNDTKPKMQYYIIKMKQADKSIIYGVIKADSVERAKSLVLQNANKFALELPKSDVFTKKKELSIVKVIVIERDIDRVMLVKKEDIFDVLVYAKGKKPEEFELSCLESFKSLYKAILDKGKLNGKAVIYFRQTNWQSCFSEVITA